MSILVYGANGYVGRLRCDRAVSAEDRVPRRAASVSSATGASTTATLTTPDASLHTAECALAIARLVVDGSCTAGLRTPAQQFGSDFVLEMPGVTRRDR